MAYIKSIDFYKTDGWAVGAGGTILMCEDSDIILPQSQKSLQIKSYPNPLGLAGTNIEIENLNSDLFTIQVINLLGKEMAEIFYGYLPPGEHSFRWIPSNCESSIYVIRAYTSTDMNAIKCVFIK